MSAARKAEGLLSIADAVDAARLLVEAGGMATQSLTRDQRGPLAELLGEISDRLHLASAAIREAEGAS